MERERFLISFFLALVLHLVLLAILQLFIKLDRERLPRYSGPLFVQLEEVPTLTTRPPQAGPRAAAPPAVVEKPKPSEARREAAARPPAAGSDRPVPSAERPGIQGAEARQEARSRPVPEAPPLEQPPVAGEAARTARPEGGGKTPAPAPAAAGEQPREAYQPLVPLDRLDRALAERQNAPAAAGAGAERVPSGPAAAGESSGSESPYRIEWEDPAQGREALSTPLPRIPEWVSRQGLALRVTVSFILIPQGILTGVTIEESSGYSDVDASVLEAVRRWKFKPTSGTRQVRGRVPYTITPR